MLTIDYMEAFSARIDDVERALAAARTELNDQLLPAGVGPLRLVHHEVRNILQAVVGFADTAPDERDTDEETVFKKELSEGVDELADQFFLSQFPATLDEVCGSFRSSLANLIRLHPDLMGRLSPIWRALKGYHGTRMAASKKFGHVADLAAAEADALDSAAAHHVLRVLDEIADFGDCLVIAQRRPGARALGERPVAANDDRA
jgi:hypothetical protein